MKGEKKGGRCGKVIESNECNDCQDSPGLQKRIGGTQGMGKRKRSVEKSYPCHMLRQTQERLDWSTLTLSPIAT